MLDTDTCIYLINGHPKLEPLAEPDDCAISVVVFGELQGGKLLANGNAYKAKIDHFLPGITVADIDDVIGAKYAEIRVFHESNGQPIGPNYLWNAAHARAMEVSPVTNNTRAFSRVRKLAIDTWMTD